ncbi:MAG: BatA domain-containing protein [Gemmataceae bacterium]|nr:BatA domain-containing protein [Gemmataceae bacterium]
MQFAAPMMLAGAAAIAIPIVLHLFYRARYKPLPWGPMTFLRQAIEQTRRRLRLQELILLLLRCLAIVLLAVALARPGWSGLTAASRDGPVDAVFLVDVSYSMGAADGGVSRLDRAKEAARALLDHLPAGSSIQVVTFADRAWLVGPQQRFNLDQARLLLERLEPTALATDLLPGLTLAWEAAQSGLAPAKEVYVFTDLQRLGLERNVEALRAKAQEIRNHGQLVFVQCGHPQRQPTNVAIEGIQWQGVIPHTRTRMPFTVILHNWGTTPVRGIQAAVEIDGRAVEKDAIQIDRIEPGQSWPVTLSGSLEEPGIRIVRAQIRGDDLPGDNVFYIPLLVRDKIRVLLVDGTPNPDDPVRAGDHFVRTALKPGRSPDHFIETESVSATEVGPRHLDGKEAVYLLNVPLRTESNPLGGPSPEFWDELVKFVRNGGGLIIAAGDNVSPFTYQTQLGPEGRDLLPFPLTGKRKAEENAPYRLAAPSLPTDCFLADFRKPGYAEALERISLQQTLTVDENGPGRVLIRDTQGQPYLMQRHLGEGLVLLFASSLDESWCHFSADPGSFHVPMALLILKHLTERRRPAQMLTAGETILWTVPDTLNQTSLEMLLPPVSGEKNPERAPLALPTRRPGQSRLQVQWTETYRAGIYGIVPQGRSLEAAAEHGSLFVVNPDLRESTSLAVATPEEMTEWLGFAPAIVPAGAGETVPAIQQLRSRGEWTEYLLTALLVLLVIESAWAWVCGRAW